MRPEYIEAVNAVRWGWSLWICFIVPSLIIWLGIMCIVPAFTRRRIAVAAGVFAFAWFSQWLLLVVHAEHMQSTKELRMRKSAEMDDWASDTWRVFAPITAVPFSLLYCSINLAMIGLVRTVWLMRNRSRLLVQEKQTDSLENSTATRIARDP